MADLQDVWNISFLLAQRGQILCSHPVSSSIAYSPGSKEKGLDEKMMMIRDTRVREGGGEAGNGNDLASHSDSVTSVQPHQPHE